MTPQVKKVGGRSGPVYGLSVLSLSRLHRHRLTPDVQIVRRSQSVMCRLVHIEQISVNVVFEDES